jgi:outer membrane immunogenic protein
MKALLLSATAAAVLAISPAFAADMPLKAPTAPEAVYSWTGIYFGGSGGIAVGRHKDFCAISGGSGCARDADDARWVGGGFAGIQWQSGQFVFGAEAKWMATDLNSFGDCPNTAFRCTIRTDNYWTAGARLGYTLGNGLFYATGGYAQSKIDRDTIFKATNVVDQTWSATHSGWFIGSGAEFRVTNTGWVIGFEYNHLDFGSKSATSGPGATSGIITTTTVKTTVDTYQARLSYLFNWWGR